MRYQVPQFIEVEDKIFGPLTLKQFIYLAGGAGLCLFFFTLLPLYIALLFMIPVAGLAAALAFYKINGRPFIEATEHAFTYTIGHKLYLWKPRHADEKPAAAGSGATSAQPAAVQLAGVPKLSQSKLKDLSWSLNIKDRATMGVAQRERTGFEI